jgi:hypothetical protein
MKKVTILLLVIFAFNLSNAQKKLKEVESFDFSMSFEEVKKKYRAGFFITKELILKDGSKVFIGDTIKLGPSSSKVSNRYETIFIGRISGLMNKDPENASTNFVTNTYVLNKVKVQRFMGDITLKIELRDVYFKGGIIGSAYLSASDYSIISGELINPNALMTRAQAIAKLKESKDLLDLDIMTQEEYDVLKKKLTPIIKGGK